LFAHYDAWQWKPDMIWFDNLSVVRTPNYYVQKMYANNMGTNVLPIISDGKPVTGQDSLYSSAVFDKENSELVVKIVNAGDKIQDINVALNGLQKIIAGNEVKIICLHTNQPGAVNTLEAPNTVVPGYSSVWAQEKGFNLKVQGNAFYVCRVKIQESTK
jgi:alpha-L-arabinofuranosidase